MHTGFSNVLRTYCFYGEKIQMCYFENQNTGIIHDKNQKTRICLIIHTKELPSFKELTLLYMSHYLKGVPEYFWRLCELSDYKVYT